jgi:hypothetical protein
METELKSAKEAGSESAVRERIHSLKTLCELVLDEPQNGGGVGSSLQPIRPQSQTMSAPLKHSSVVIPTHEPYQPQTQAPTQAKKLEMGDGANGDSLLDF